MSVTTKRQYRIKRHLRIRKKVVGTADRPRLTVFISNKNIYAQIIDDQVGTTLVAASSMKSDIKGGVNVAKAELVGKDLAEKAKAKGIKTLIVDRAGYKYAKRLAALVDAVRAADIKI